MLARLPRTRCSSAGRLRPRTVDRERRSLSCCVAATASMPAVSGKSVEIDGRPAQHLGRVATAGAIVSTLHWMQKRISQEFWGHVASSFGTLMAFVTCMLLSLAVAAAVCLVRFKIRQDRRRMAQEQRKQDKVQWARQRVRRALVLGQSFQELRMADDSVGAHEIVRDIRLAQQHALSLSRSLRSRHNTKHITGHVMCACFRPSNVDNWRMTATGKALYKAVHGLPLGRQERGVVDYIPQQELAALQLSGNSPQQTEGEVKVEDDSRRRGVPVDLNYLLQGR